MRAAIKGKIVLVSKDNGTSAPKTRSVSKHKTGYIISLWNDGVARLSHRAGLPTCLSPPGYNAS